MQTINNGDGRETFCEFYRVVKFINQSFNRFFKACATTTTHERFLLLSPSSSAAQTLTSDPGETFELLCRRDDVPTHQVTLRYQMPLAGLSGNSFDKFEPFR